MRDSDAPHSAMDVLGCSGCRGAHGSTQPSSLPMEVTARRGQLILTSSFALKGSLIPQPGRTECWRALRLLPCLRMEGGPQNRAVPPYAALHCSTNSNAPSWAERQSHHPCPPHGPEPAAAAAGRCLPGKTSITAAHYKCSQCSWRGDTRPNRR